MNKKIILISTVVAALTGFLIWWFSASQVLARRSSDIIDCVRLEADTGRVQRAFKAENLRDLIADNVTIVYPEMTSTFQHARSSNEPVNLTEQLAKSALLYLGEMSEWITVENESVTVLSHGDGSAKVAVSFELTAKLKGKAEQKGQLEGIFTFEKIEGKWLLTEARF